MASRYRNRTEQIIPKKGVYEEILENRGVNKKGIVAYASPAHMEMSKYANEELDIIYHKWTVGDRFYKLSNKYYGSTKYWWIIAKYNGKPTEAHVSIGEVLHIPMPAYKAIEHIKV